MRPNALLADSRGNAALEYLIIFVLVSVGASLALIALGTPLFELFLLQRALLLSPIP